MSTSDTAHVGRQRDAIEAMIAAAIGGNVLTGEDGGFVKVMARNKPQIQQDIPAAFEMYTLLSHYIGTLPLQAVAFDSAEQSLAPAIRYDEAQGRLVALIPLAPGEMELVAYWVSGGLRSDMVKAMAGVLALPFSIETHDNVPHLVPEWFAAFYVGASEDHCVPILTLPSITSDERIGDWVEVALLRMPMFGLPCANAAEAVKHQEAAAPVPSPR